MSDRSYWLVSTVDDILEELHIKNTTTRLRQSFGEATEEENKIIQILENEPIEFDIIVHSSNMSASEVGSLLSVMEIKGMIKQIDNRYTIVA